MAPASQVRGMGEDADGAVCVSVRARAVCVCMYLLVDVKRAKACVGAEGGRTPLVAVTRRSSPVGGSLSVRVVETGAELSASSWALACPPCLRRRSSRDGAWRDHRPPP